MTSVDRSTNHPTTDAGDRLSRVLRTLWVHRWFVLAAAGLVGAGGWEAARLLIGPEVVADRVIRATIIETVVATGNVLTPYRANVGSQIIGTVVDVAVEEGQRVAKGQVLIRLDESELRSAVVQAEGALAEAQARLRQLTEVTLPTAGETLAQMQATLMNAQKTWDRTSALVTTGAATVASLDDARKALDVARAQVNAAKVAVYTASPGGSDEVMARTQERQAQANLEVARARLSYSTIAAPRDGVLIARNVENGYVVQPGAALLVLAPDGKVQIALQVDERNLGKLNLGQSAVVSADAFPDRTFRATVSFINPAVDINRASVEIKLDVPDPPPFLRQDMTVSVDIEAERRSDALVVPARSVHDELSGTPWVLGVRNGRAYKQPVVIGLHGDTQVEIRGGLNAGDLVVPATSGVLSGQRIRPVVP
jgi:HlyD family secretion protein